MTPRFFINQVTFNDGTVLPCDKNDIIVFVGANNSGKSASLKEIAAKFQQKDILTKVVKDIVIERQGNKEDFLKFFEESSQVTQDGVSTWYKGMGYSVTSQNVQYTLSDFKKGLSLLYGFYAKILTTEERLSAANPPVSIRFRDEPIQHPIQQLQKRDSLEKEFNEYFRQAFDADLIVHRGGGSDIPLYVGGRPDFENGEDRVSESYLEKIDKLDFLHEQGDGMRSFVGVLLYCFAANYNLLFIDEPEAFLHPPQARLLGKMIAKSLPSNRQLFLSTHSEDFLKGLLEPNTSNLKIVRLNRHENINNISILKSEEIEFVWKDSLLRHSNVLNGLFHSKVVVCESDSDSRFYSAILDAIFEDSEVNYPDILFVNVGGKARVPVAIKALRKLRVPVKVIVDFDVLNNDQPLRSIYEDLGGDWNEINTDWRLVKTEIESKKADLTTEDVKNQISEIINSVTERIFPKNKIGEINKILKKNSPWAHAKEGGKSFIPSGNATQAFDRLQKKFIEKGLLIPEVGELEGFVKSVGNHGPKWINEVLTKDLKNDSKFDSAKDFVRLIID